MTPQAPPFFVIVMSLLVLPAGFAVTAFFLYHYLQAAFALRKVLEDRYHEVWEKLGRPCVINAAGGAAKPPVPMISPAFPLVLWLWEGAQERFDAETRILADNARSHLILGGGALLVLFVAVGFLALFTAK